MRDGLKDGLKMTVRMQGGTDGMDLDLDLDLTDRWHGKARGWSNSEAASRDSKQFAGILTCRTQSAAKVRSGVAVISRPSRG